jgi:hypothetical protein
LILATIRPNISFRFGGRLTVVDLSQPGLRHILADEFAGKYKWISAEKESSANGAPSVR